MQADKSTVTRLVQPKLLDILGGCREMVAAKLPGSLKSALDKADDALFELANKADSSQKQNGYFDALRELRLKRNEFECEFLHRFNVEFEHGIDLEKPRPAERPDDDMVLSLIDSDAMEESLAVTNFVEAVSSRCKEELFALDKRIGFLLNEPDLDTARNPLGPRAIGNAFRAACGQLQSDIEIKLTLFKLFDKYSGAGLLDLYHDINQRLVREEILPKIRTGVHRAGHTPRRTKITIETQGDGDGSPEQDVFSTLHDLMLACDPGVHGVGMAGASSTGPGGPLNALGAAAPAARPLPANGRARLFSGMCGEPVAAGGQPATPCEGGAPGASTGNVIALPFVEQLTQLQQGDASYLHSCGIDASMIEAGNVNVLRTLRDAGAVSYLGQTAALTLDIVSILFDYILDDPAIPDTMKALIGRLQIPLLKVALIDKGVFSRKSHPARRLLDALAAAAVGWSDGAQHGDGLHEMVARSVRRIVDEFEDDVALFEQVLVDFLQFIEQEEKSAEQLAQASANSLHGKERIVMAKLAVDEVVKERIGSKDTREFVRRFVLDYWRQLMIITYVDQGSDSDEWKSQLDTVEQLVWSVEPKTTPAARKELTTRLPALIKAIKQGMATLEMDHAECSRVLSMLASVHVVSVKNAEESSLAERHLNDISVQRAAVVLEATVPSAAGENDEEFIKQGLARLFERKGVEPQELDIDFSSFDEAQEVGEEPPHDAELMEYVKLVMTLNCGDWIAFDNPDGSSTRARFTWISPATGRYLFTTRSGRRALDTTLDSLAREFQRGTACVVNAKPDPIFDRAIGDLIEKLEQRAFG